MTPYANTQAKANIYREQNVMTASPGELTLMLYDGCVKEIKLMRMYIDEGGIEKANEASLQAQAILSELMRSLDMRYEMAKELYSLYEFIVSELVYANVHKSGRNVEQVLEILLDLRDTWQKAIRINRQKALKTEGAL